MPVPPFWPTQQNVYTILKVQTLFACEACDATFVCLGDPNGICHPALFAGFGNSALVSKASPSSKKCPPAT